MPGFTGYIEFNNEKKFKFFNKNISPCFHLRDVSLQVPQPLYVLHSTINKFLADKVFFKRDNIFFAIEGVILNNKELQKYYHAVDWEDTICKMYQLNGEKFFKDFRGSFSGVIVDLNQSIAIIYTSHIGDKQIFYFNNDNFFVFSSTFFDLCDQLKNNSISNSLNPGIAYLLLTYGFVASSQTLINDINRIPPGSYLKLSLGKRKNDVSIKRYYMLDNSPTNIKNEADKIDEIDYLFRQAVTRSFQKDEEYNYKHMVTLSGGLDSRMVTWVANTLGYNAININFAQSNSLDAKIALKIASYIGNQFIYKMLDDGMSLLEIEETTRLLGGCSIYSGMVHFKTFCDFLDLSNVGIMHSGQLGDVVIGSFNKLLDYGENYSVTSCLYSKFLLSKINKNILIELPKNLELFLMYTRGMLGANNALQVIQEKTETFSPFYDVDLMNCALKIPINERAHHKFYYKWINKKYPGAADFVYAKYGCKINDLNLVYANKCRVYLKNIPSLFMNKMKLNKNFLLSKKHMNPFDYWYATKPIIKNCLDTYFEQTKNLLNGYPELLHDCSNMYLNGNVIDKTLVLTLLSSMKIAGQSI